MFSLTLTNNFVNVDLVMRAAWIADLRQGARLALRQLRASPRFGITTLLTLALGIGAPTAVFSVVHAVLLAPLPYREPDRVVRLSLSGNGPNGPVTFPAVPVTLIAEWQRRSDTAVEFAVFNDRALTFDSPDGPVRLVGASTTANLFALLGVNPLLGNTFTRDDRDGRQIVLSYGAWTDHFNAAPDIVGRTISLDNQSYQVMGVMPASFTYPSPDAAFWMPQDLVGAGGRGLLLPAIARLRPDVTVAGLLREGRLLQAEDSPGPVRLTLQAETLHDQMTGRARTPLVLMMAGVLVVFSIAVVSAAMLLVTRGVGREHEFMIRLSLGATRERLIRQLLGESVVLSGLGGLAGVAAAAIGLEVLLRTTPADVPRLDHAALNAPVLVFALIVTAVAMVVISLTTAGRRVLPDVVTAIFGRVEPSLTRRRSAFRKLQVLASAEVALTLVLLVAAGLLLSTFLSLAMAPRGFEPTGSLAFQLSLPAPRYPTGAARLAFLDNLLDRARAVPGVTHAGFATSMPNRQATGRFGYNSVGVPVLAAPGSFPISEVRIVSEGFFEALGMRVVSGRGFTRQDDAGAEPVMVIDAALAREQFPDRRAVGHLLYSDTGNRRVIGVTEIVPPAVRIGNESTAAYLPVRQHRDVMEWWATVTFVVRTSGNPRQLIASARTLVRSLDPALPVYNIRAVEDELSGLVAAPRFASLVLGWFGLSALLMAALGVYGVLAHGVEMRTHDIGLRLALGATPGAILRSVGADGLRILGAGIGAGLLVAPWMSHWLANVFDDVPAGQPFVFGGILILLIFTCLAAMAVPARRAIRITPLAALRRQ